MHFYELKLTHEFLSSHSFLLLKLQEQGIQEFHKHQTISPATIGLKLRTTGKSLNSFSREPQSNSWSDFRQIWFHLISYLRPIILLISLVEIRWSVTCRSCCHDIFFKMLCLGKGSKKKEKKRFIFQLGGGGGGQRGSIITFYFFLVPNALKIISRH